MKIRVISLSIAYFILVAGVSQCFLLAGPLDTWHWNNPAPLGLPLNDAAFGNGVFVIVADHPCRIATSADRISWNVAVPQITACPSDISFINGSFIGGGPGTVITSPDGKSWREQPSGIADSLTKIVYGNGLYVALTSTGSLASSVDGKAWTIRYPAGKYPSVLVFGNGLFVAAGSPGESLTSPDGITWTQVSLNALPISSGAFGNGVFVLKGYFYFTPMSPVNTLYASSDGVEWKEVYRSDSLGDVVFINGIFMTSRGGSLITSSDGTTWTSVDSPAIAAFDAIVFGNNSYLAISSLGYIAASSDGAIWNKVSSNSVGFNLIDIASDGNVFVAVGTAPSIHMISNIYISHDGVDWKTTASDFPFYFGHIAWGGGSFVLIGQRGSGPTIITSHDGTTWREANLGTFARYLIEVSYGNGMFIAVGIDGAIITSTDGENWVEQNSGTTNNLTSVAYGNGVYIAIGEETPGLSGKQVLTSPDAIHWNADTAPIGATLAYGNGVFVTLAPTGDLYASTNGKDWSIRYSYRPNPSRTATVSASFGYGNAGFVAVDYVGEFMLTSADGRTWQARPSPAYHLNAVTYGKGSYIAVGDNGVILQSSSFPAMPVYRFYNMASDTHFYTMSEGEKEFIAQSLPQFILEGPQFYAFGEPDSGALPVYRFYNYLSGDHFYTISPQEKDYIAVMMPQYLYEGAAFYSFPNAFPCTAPVYRYYDAKTDSHFYTISEEERAYIDRILPQWLFEGVAFYSYKIQ